MMRRNLRRSILRSLGRYVAIAMIIGLGCGIFVGLRSTKTDMVATGQQFMDEQNLFDLRLISTYGWGRDQLEEIAALDGIVDAEGVFYSDLIAKKTGASDLSVYRFYTIPERISLPRLLEGRMPEAPNECLADGYYNKQDDIGAVVTISEDNSIASLDCLNCRSFTVVGIVSSPLYMDMNRGNTSVGSGSIAEYYYVPPEAFSAGYYTEIHAVIACDHTVYSDAFNEAMTAAADQLKPQLVPFAQDRLVSAKAEAEETYQNGKQEYEDAVAEYEREKADALQELADAKQTLEDGQAKLEQGELDLEAAEDEISAGWEELEAGRQKLADAKAALEAGEAGGDWQLAGAKAELTAKQAELETNSQEVEAGLIQINTALVEIQSGQAQIQAGAIQINALITPLEAMLQIADTNITLTEASMENLRSLGFPESHLAGYQVLLNGYNQSKAEYQGKLAELYAQRTELESKAAEVAAAKVELEAKREELLAAREQIRAGRQAILDGFQQINTGRTNMGNQLISARQQILDGEIALRDSEKQLRDAERELAEGRLQLEANRAELENGWAEYAAAEQEAQFGFAEAEEKLADAAAKLEDARAEIDRITKTDVYVLDRNSNIGYVSLNSNSDIVAGVARVIPAFFLLVAALVCITTMTRMVDEERTQIGTLKALGYGSGAIISKYLLYAGSGALLGCACGIGLGSVIFPVILWEAYKIILFITPGVRLCFDWQMASWVVALYTAAMLLVTWYCCYKALKEVPAELIRPKAPAVGKTLLIERLPLWRHMSFLNKVAVRNILRYRQRLAMMLVGIGGCTALLMTGFGIRDSISRIVDVQYRDVTHFDMEIIFSGDRTPEQQEKFLEDMGNFAEDVMFFYQVTGEIEDGNQTREVYLIAAEDRIADFIDFHYRNKPVSMPEDGGVLLSAGIMEIMGLQIGDTVTLRNPDMEPLQVTITGIYENHVNNYAFVTPGTIREQWGREAEQQMAYLTVREGRSPNAAGARANGLDGVVNVTVSQELAQMVNKMMSAMDLVVIVVVFCAGVLAAIVLYNLTNININERIREIATIKVLGFNAGETAMYVFKENLVLTCLGTLFGIPLGKLLLDFVISQVKIDMIWIKTELQPQSLMISVALTILSAVIVDGFFYFRLDKINMAEALKSVE